MLDCRSFVLERDVKSLPLHLFSHVVLLNLFVHPLMVPIEIFHYNRLGPHSTLISELLRLLDEIASLVVTEVNHLVDGVL